MYIKIIKNNFVFFFTLFFAVLIPLKFVLFPNLEGEDEVLTFLINVKILNFIQEFDFKQIIIELIKDWHPPGRNLLSITTLSFLPDTISTTRLIYYILWIFSTLLVVKISKKICSDKLAYVSASLICLSGIFHIQIMSFAHVAVTFFGLIIILILLSNENEKISLKKYTFLMSVSFLGFLFFNTFILITIGLNILVIYEFFKDKKLKSKEFINFIALAFLFFLFYLLYYFIFLGLPYLVTFNQNFVNNLNYYFNELNFGNWDGKPFGQLHQYMTRNDNATLNTQAFLSNIRYLNWHFFPFIGFFIFIISYIMIFINFKKIFILLLPYFLIFNFYIQGNTVQHFASLFIWCLPFFPLWMKKLNFSRIVNYVLYFVSSFVLFFYTFTFHIKDYNSKNYPILFSELFYGDIKWAPNIKRPLEEISREVKSISSKDQNILYSIDGAFLYYLRDYKTSYKNINEIRSMNEKSRCELFNDIKLFITLDINNPCKELFIKKIRFQNSNIVVYENKN